MLMMLIPSYETVIQTTKYIDDDKEKEERKEKEEEKEKEKGGKKKKGKKKSSSGKCDDNNNKQENEKKEEEKAKEEEKEKKTNPSIRASSSPPPLPPLPPPRVIPLLVEPETTTSYDMGAQVSVLTKTQQNPWWRIHPPELLSASRPLGPFYPISGACVYCGGPWQAAEGKKCRYHPSSTYLTNLVLFKPYAVASNTYGFNATNRRNANHTKLFTCQHCQQSIFKSQLDVSAHELLCDLRLFPCPNIGCHVQCTKMNRDFHIERQCQYRPVTCIHEGCNEIVISSKIDFHQLKQCGWRQIKCPMVMRGCRHTCVVTELFEHLKHCTYVTGSSSNRGRRGKKNKSLGKRRKKRGGSRCQSPQRKDQKETAPPSPLSPLPPPSTTSSPSSPSRLKTRRSAIKQPGQAILQAASNITMTCTYENCTFFGKNRAVAIDDSRRYLLIIFDHTCIN